MNHPNFPLALLLATACFSTSALAADPAPAPQAAAPAAGGQQQQRVPAARGPALDLAIEAARVALDTCAAAGGQKIAASVVDSAGVLKALLAYDGASPRGVSSSTAKAVTALQFKTATADLTERIKTDKALGDQIAANTALNARPGGVLIKVGDEIIGAIGVGGGRTDHDCAVAGVNKIQDRLK
jgi:uncharacterized protein GlcG (DUF336 family)